MIIIHDLNNMRLSELCQDFFKVSIYPTIA
jgi:hypothetical protein